MGKLQTSTPFSLVILLLCFVPSNTVPLLESFIYGGCSPVPFATNSAFSTNLSSLLSSLTTSATSSSYNNYTITSPSKNDVVHGLYQCRGDLQGSQCSSCVAKAVSLLDATCPSSSGAVVQLQGCYAKYDATSFFGVEDKSVVLKKFGPAVGLEREKTVGPERDEVLTELLDGSSPFTAVGSGSVRGIAQCVGDLSINQCRDCVDRAVQLLRSQGDVAAYGDVFLAKCYARFSVAASIGGGGYAKRMGSVKTFAIIAGLLAGTVILVIFFTFLSTAFGGKHSDGK